MSYGVQLFYEKSFTQSEKYSVQILRLSTASKPTFTCHTLDFRQTHRHREREDRRRILPGVRHFERREVVHLDVLVDRRRQQALRVCWVKGDGGDRLVVMGEGLLETTRTCMIT